MTGIDSLYTAIQDLNQTVGLSLFGLMVCLLLIGTSLSIAIGRRKR